MLQLYSQNPRYLQYKGKPLILVGSGEHYGALLNLDFDYKAYFKTLKAAGLNQTRVFSGTYRESPGAFAIEENTLAPRPERFISPWREVRQGVFDLEQWNPDYFLRLHDLLKHAEEAEVMVEFVLFCFWYDDKFWQNSPMHPANNLQKRGTENKEEVYKIEGDLIPTQEAFVRKIVQELNRYENLYYEICNEPYSRNDHTAYLEWQAHIATTLAKAEESLPKRHLIAQNVQNRSLRVTHFPKEVSIINFHYAIPDAAIWNYHLPCVLADDETGFAGQEGTPYRVEAWNFMLAGGGIFSHLDYSFTLSHPDGTAPITGKTPGGGGAELRKQFRFLRTFLEEVEVWNLRPLSEVLTWDAGDVRVQALGDFGRFYVVYFSTPLAKERVGLGVSGGSYEARWFSPELCSVVKEERITHSGGYLYLVPPTFEREAVLTLTRL